MIFLHRVVSFPASEDSTLGDQCPRLIAFVGFSETVEWELPICFDCRFHFVVLKLWNPFHSSGTANIYINVPKEC